MIKYSILNKQTIWHTHKHVNSYFEYDFVSHDSRNNITKLSNEELVKYLTKTKYD